MRKSKYKAEKGEKGVPQSHAGRLEKDWVYYYSHRVHMYTRIS